jgi:hypothetical protein
MHPDECEGHNKVGRSFTAGWSESRALALLLALMLMLGVVLVFLLIDLGASGPGQDLNSPLYAFRAS